ncbi:sensor histidine kinase [Tsuneonella aeria]|nr:CHASE3 domain-containing protein [Tsuneonella aeria]
MSAAGTPAKSRASGLRRAYAHAATLAVFALVAASLLGVVLLIYRTVEAERTQRDRVAQMSAVLAELVSVNRAVLNAETGQRGYLLTLDRRYLGPYLAAREQYGPALSRLDKLLEPVASPRQRHLLAQVENLTNSKFGEMADSVSMVERGALLDARTSMLSDEGMEVMVRLRAAIRELEMIEQEQLAAATRDAAEAEGRVLPLLGALLAMLLLALGLGYRLVGRTARAEAEAAQASVVAEARDRADLLARELNHRVKNLFAVILAIVRMSAKDTPEAQPVAERIAERIHALVASHEVTQGSASGEGARLRTLVESTVRPYLSSERQVALDGPDIVLPARQVTPLGLVLHELTTNAVKYGCWSSGGDLAVSWWVEDGMASIDWREHFPGTDEEPERTGFGSLLMTSAARQLRGTIERRFTGAGVAVSMRIPITDEHPVA